MNKQQKQIRQEILDHTSLRWVRKDVFKMPNEASFPDGFFQIKTELEKIGFILNTTYFTTFKNNIFFLFANNEFGIEVQIYFTRSFEFIHELYKLVKNTFTINDSGYFGTNEWFHDRCHQYKIPMINELKHLNPPDPLYWYCNELCKPKE
jgi:hypothetical protein